MLVFFGREDAGRGCELCSRNFSPNGAGGNFHLGVVADALRLSHVAAGHDVKLVAVFSEPYGRGDASEIYFCPAIGEGIGLAMANIVAGSRWAIVNRLSLPGGLAAGVAGSQVALRIALIL